MANDVLDHLMADFADARTAHQAAWQSLVKTGLPYDPNDGLRHSLLRWVKKPEGFQVTVVVPGGPADKAGVKVQDIIAKVNDVDVRSMSQDDLIKLLGGAESYTLVVERPGGSVTLTVHTETYADLVKALQH
jgi:C-terminal processing protease CtpA/Prc